MLLYKTEIYVIFMYNKGNQSVLYNTNKNQYVVSHKTNENRNNNITNHFYKYNTKT